jgi:8-amino-7-oxononanoate synthase
MPDTFAPAEVTPLDARLHQQLQALREQNLYRLRRVIDGAHGARITVDGRACINFCSNDYLGLAADPRVAEAARAALARSGTGSGAAALVSGYDREHAELEQALAAATGRPRALLFSSGWAANLGVLRALLGKDDTLVADELNHASLIDGGRLSGARYVRVAHARAAAFEAALRAAGGADGSAQVLAATDTVFSMDGDLAPVDALGVLCRRHGAALMVDDAHGFGVLAPPAARLPAADVYVATLGKALGAAGAFVAGSEALVEFLIQRARSWVFSTAPPPALAAAARRALAITQSPEGEQLRAQLSANVRCFRAGCAARGIALAESDTPIQPLIVGDEARALRLSQALMQRGYWVAAIRPPTVPRGTSRLRITFSAAHTRSDVEGLLDALAAAMEMKES